MNTDKQIRKLNKAIKKLNQNGDLVFIKNKEYYYQLNGTFDLTINGFVQERIR